MLESEELIQVTLDTAGEELQFGSSNIKGIPGHLVYNVQSFDSPYDIDKQDFDFQVSKKDFEDSGFQVDNLFTYILGTSSYCFRIIKIIDDLTGWFQLSVNLEGVSDVC